MSAENSGESTQAGDSDGYDASVSYVSSNLPSRVPTPVYLPSGAQRLGPEPQAAADDQALPVQGSTSNTQAEDATGPSRVPTPWFAKESPLEWSSIPTSDDLREFEGSFAKPLSLLEARARSLQFSKPLPPFDVIGEIIMRRRLDDDAFPVEFIDGFLEPFPPRTGIEGVDELSREYYNLQPAPSSLRENGSPLSYVYPIRAVLKVKQDLQGAKRGIFPEPVPINILSPLDYVGPSRIVQGEDGWAFIVPSEKTIWEVVLKRGVDKFYRPLFFDPAGRPRAVITESFGCGMASYCPRTMVTSQFAVNLFLQLPGSHTYRPAEIQVEYLGTYVMRYIDNITMTTESFRMISDEDMNRIYRDLSPGLSTVSKPNMRFPFVRFSYVEFDNHLIGAIDEAVHGVHADESVARLQEDIVEGVVDNSLNQQDVTWDYRHDDDDDLYPSPPEYLR